jgi:hypothetical protein
VVITAGITGSICASVLLIAGLMKINSLALFGKQVAAYQIAPERISELVGYILPPAEIVLGIAMLFIPQLSAAAMLLFAAFAVAIGVNLLRGRTELRCGCFGVTGKQTISVAHFAANIGLLLLAALTFIEQHRPTFLALQIGISAALVFLLASAWRAMIPRPLPDTEEVPQP